ncbi:MAG: cytochrome c-type biogenesis protein CcmH [Dehalococcoidales bacterium]|nr:cytochrome c-type biogenesis protein CcmH [Dehalococcoidales bacterium]
MKLGNTFGAILAGAILLFMILSASPVMANSVTVSDIDNELICQCGCTAVLSNCTHGECMVRDSMTTVIKQKIDDGQSKEQIVQFFVAQYGEQVLASPPKQGFNLVAWLLPFAAILAGGGVIYFAIRKWVGQGQADQAKITTEVEEGEEEEYRYRLEMELKAFEERGFR